MRVLNTMEVETFEAIATSQKAHDDALAELSQVANPSSLLNRENVRVPISPVAVPNDEVLYQDPLRADTFYYLPKYEVVREEVSGEPRYRIEMIESNQGWTLTIFIEPYISEALLAKAGDATGIAHTLTASIQYTKSGQFIVKSFDEIEDSVEGKRLAMNLVNIEQRDDVFTALSTHEFSTSLIVERKIEVAVPVEVDAPIKPPTDSGFSVILKKIGNKLSAIKAVRLWVGTDLRKAKSMIEQPLPAILASGLPKDRAHAFAKALDASGSVVTVEGANTQQPPRLDTRRVDVLISHLGNNTSHVLVVLEKFAGIHPSKAKALLSKSMPVQILASASIEQARELVAQLKKVGAKTSIKASRRSASAIAASQFSSIKPKLEFVGSEQVDIRGTLFTRYSISVTNTNEIPGDLFLAAPDLPPCGRNVNSSRTWVDISDQNGKRLYGYCGFSKPASLSKLGFSLKKGTIAPKSVRIVLNDRRMRKSYASNLAPIENAPRAKEIKYQITHQTCKQNVAPTPFHFDVRLHSYIYRFLGNQSGAELIRHELQFDGQPHSYYIDANQRHLVYFFPDQFKIARWDRPPYAPKMSVQINSREDDTGISDVIMTYLTAPVTDRQRLKQAAAAFSENLMSDEPELDLQPYPVVDYSFHVSHPIAAGNRSSDQDVSANAFYQGIHTTLLMELPDFVQCFASLTSQTAAPFHGTVSVAVSEDEKVHLPFIADFSDLAGKYFDHAILENDDGSVSLTLINSIESSLNIAGLSVELERDGSSTETNLTSTPGLPSLLAPGQNISLELVPNTTLVGSKPLKALLDTSAIDVVLDDDAVFNSIVNRSTTEYFRMITVQVVPMVFSAVEGRESEQVIGLIIHVEGSQGTHSIDLDIEHLKGSARVDYSVDDLVLRNETSISYRYWYQVARANGSIETIEGGESTASKFFLDVSRVIEGDSA